MMASTTPVGAAAAPRATPDKISIDDFAKVEMRVGQIKTAERKSVVAIPIQALAMRTRKELEDAAKNAKGQGSGVTLAAPPPAAPRSFERRQA